MILEQIERDLLLEPFSLLKAESTKQAMQILAREKIHVILCDQKMPHGMSGTELIYQAKQKQPHIVGMILSAFSEPEYLLHALNQAKVLYYLLKPWDKKELIEKLIQALQACEKNLTLQKKKQEEELHYTQNMLTEAVQELYKTKGALQEATTALSSISTLTSELSSGLKKKILNGLPH